MSPGRKLKMEAVFVIILLLFVISLLLKDVGVIKGVLFIYLYISASVLSIEITHPIGSSLRYSEVHKLIINFFKFFF